MSHAEGKRAGMWMPAPSGRNDMCTKRGNVMTSVRDSRPSVSAGSHL